MIEKLEEALSFGELSGMWSGDIKEIKNKLNEVIEILNENKISPCDHEWNYVSREENPMCYPYEYCVKCGKRKR